eukprot:2901322-Rhodomonas_salina.2
MACWIRDFTATQNVCLSDDCDDAMETERNDGLGTRERGSEGGSEGARAEVLRSGRRSKGFVAYPGRGIPSEERAREYRPL